MDLDPGDVVLIEIQFHQKPGAKIRPAIAILVWGGHSWPRAGLLAG